MAARLRQFFTAPEYPGEPERTALAQIFHMIAGAVFIALCISIVSNLLFTKTGVPIVLPVTAAVVGALIAAARMGHLRFAGTALPLVLLVASTDFLLTRDGVHDNVIVVIAGVLVVGGVLLRRRVLAVFTAAALTMILAVGYAEIAGFLNNRLSGFTDIRYLIGICLTYLVIAITVRVLTESLFSGLREAGEKGTALTESYARLQQQAAAIKQSEARFSKILQASPAATTIADFEDGTFIEVNQAALDLFGRTREEVIGQTALGLGLWPNPEDRARFVKALRAGGALALLPVMARRKSGELREALLSAARIEVDDQKQMLMSAVDITDMRRAEKLQRQSEERFAKIFQASPDAIVISRLEDGRYLEVNQRWLDVFGYTREELVGRSSLDLGIWVDPADRARFVEQVRARGALRDFEARFRKKSGAIIDALISTEVIDIGGEPHIIVPLMDVTDRKRAAERIQQLATRDPLTGLPNRLLLTDRLTLSVDSAQLHNSHLALLFVDLDRFKTINDSLGHAIGDAFLKSVAERLSGIMRKGDTLARIGGDEFVVLLENIVAMEDAAGQVARKILHSFTEPFSVEGHTLSCSCSIGISVFPSDTTDPQMLLRDADTAMYHVKESGRGSYRYFSSEMNARVQERLQIENGLREAIGRRQFLMAYQPKVSVASGKIVGFEALLRWQHPSRGMVSPEWFMDVAEESGLIIEIGQWVLEEVCKQVHEWQARGLPVHPVAVNLSVRQFTPALIAQIATLLDRFDIDPDLIEVEITESLFMHHFEDVSAILKGLSRVGTHVTIDDFGTGYSSLSYIKRFTVDALKIDRSFVVDVVTQPQDVAIIRAIITMARSLGIRVIAEGVETEEQLKLLRELHCDEYQGYLFSPPLAAAQVEHDYMIAA